MLLPNVSLKELLSALDAQSLDMGPGSELVSVLKGLEHNQLETAQKHVAGTSAGGAGGSARGGGGKRFFIRTCGWSGGGAARCEGGDAGAAGKSRGDGGGARVL